MKNLKFNKAALEKGKKILVNTAFATAMVIPISSAISDFNSIDPLEPEYYFQGFGVDMDNIVVNDDSYTINFYDGYKVTYTQDDLDLLYNDPNTNGHGEIIYPDIYPEGLDGNNRLMVTRDPKRLENFYYITGNNIIPGILKLCTSGLIGLIGVRTLRKTKNR